MVFFHRVVLRALVVSVFAAACSDNVADDSDVGAPVEPFAELMDAGIARYLGTALPTGSAQDDSGATNWFFDPADGPMCFHGAAYQVATRDTGSDSLLIFLQGGGACWGDYCFAVDVPLAGIPALDALNPALPENPFVGWNVVYLPYCDGSLFVGDADIDDNGDGTIDRYHRGLRNFSAALGVAASRFPGAKRVMLAGSSGGAYGALVAAPLIRHVWPGAEVLVFSDAGLGLGKPGDESFIRGIVQEWNIGGIIPASCVRCYQDGHLTQLAGWLLERDPNMRIAMFSSTNDNVIGTLFLGLDAEVFEEALRQQVGILDAAWPGRLAAFIIEGPQHTTLLGDISGFLGPDAQDSPFGDMLNLGSLKTSEVNGVSISDWITWMLERDGRWVSQIAPE